MKILQLLALALMLTAYALPAPAGITAERAQTIIAQIGPVQSVNAEMDVVFLRLINGSAGFDELAIGQASLADALSRGREAIAGAADQIDVLDARTGTLEFSEVGDRETDALLTEVLAFVTEKPALLRQFLEMLEGQVAAAEAGDFAEVDRLSGEMASALSIQIDSETVMLKLQLAAVDRQHPQHGLSGAWIATNDGMRHALALSLLDDSEVLAALEALPGQMRSAASRMRTEIARSRSAAAAMRERADPGWMAGMLRLGGYANERFLTDLLDEYADALAVEDDIADLLDYGGALFARIAAGDTGEEVMSSLVEFDVTYQRLIQQRQSEAEDRQKVLQQFGAN